MKRYAWIVAGLLAVTGCDDDSDDEPEGDATSAASDTDTEGDTEGDTEAFSCQASPTVTYDTFGRGFLATYCNGCHGQEANDRQGAPDDVVFDDGIQATDWADRIHARVFPAEGAVPMPPAGGVTPDDLERARIWLECYP